MTKIYANLIGNWTLLTESDTIMNENPYVWVKEKNIQEHDFIWVGHENTGYRIHVSQIQITN
ncbi:hypothetical protein [uncultured Ilyobacter sp.]|uniref:hypothetical protein n=1 Tax=uncultured Ilyobacter sp. TaxID=544433 RepID=UPI0029C67F97|nr:hypothetical protein [uncultured Ilyobacter sp.]